MRILIIARHYWPDVAPEGYSLWCLARHLARSGYRVDVLTTQPRFNGVVGDTLPWVLREEGTRVVRVPLLAESKRCTPLRLANAFLFCLAAVTYGLCIGELSRVITVTTPPVLAGLVGRILARLRSIKHIYWCQDLWPEVGVAIGRLAPSSITFRLLMEVESTTRRISTVATLSRDMVASIQRMIGRGKQVAHINNVAPPPVKPASTGLPAGNRSGRFTVIFTGNLGLYQGLDTIMRAAHRLADRHEIHFVFVGNGAACERLMAAAGPLLNLTVHFIPYQPLDATMELIANADVGIVSLAPHVIRFAYPSKTLAYLATGIRLLAIVEQDSELADMVVSKELGKVVEPSDDASLAASIVALHSMSRTTSHRSRESTLSATHLHPGMTLRNLEKLLQ